MTTSRQKLTYYAAAGTAVVVMAVAGCLYFVPRADAAAYTQSRLERGSIEASISATGTVNPVVSVQVGSQVSGNISALYADFNTTVKRGQLVATIDPALFEARVQQSQASLDAARASAASAQAQLRRAEADLAATKATVANLKANLARARVSSLDARHKYERRIDMFSQGVVSAEDRETAKATYDAAVASEQAAQASLDAGMQSIPSSEAQLDVARMQLVSAQAQVKQATASLSQAQVDLAHTKILAPVDGTVIARRMDVGQTVAASFQAPTIFEIAQDLARMQVDTTVDEADIGKVRNGQHAWFTVDAYPGRRFEGSVMQIRRAPINVQNVITYDVVVTVANPDHALFPGMTASVRILTDHREDALKVPNSALRLNLGNAAPAKTTGRSHSNVATIYQLDEAGKPRPARVQLGISDGQYTEITSGEIHEGDSIILAVSSKSATKSSSAARSGLPSSGGGGGPRGGPRI